MEASRFLIVSIIGLVFDIAVAWVASRYFGLPLWLAAIIGFCMAATLNYVLHELWTFRDGVQRLSVWRAMRFAFGVVGTLLVRVGAVALLARALSESHALAILTAAAAISFFINFLVSKHFVFRQHTEPRDRN